jgi:murein L,D-transpeptidase YcbB/YkuD
MRITAAALALILAGPGPAAGQAALRVNLPAYRLELLDRGRVIRRIPVAIGDPAYPSRTGRFRIRTITWDPTWVPPREEPWAAADSAMGPGGDNPMGAVKFALGGTYYLHGTPEPRSVGSAASHGCLRLRNRDAVALARYLIAATGSTDPGRDPKHRTPKGVRLARPVPVTIRYALIERRGARVAVHPDVYGLRNAASDSAGAAVIAAPGSVTPAAVALARRLLDSARNGTLTFPADSLRRAAAAPTP